MDSLNADTITLQSATSAQITGQTTLTFARPTTVTQPYGAETKLAVGQWVSGAGVPAGSFIRSFNAGSTPPEVVVSSAITSSLYEQTLTFKSTEVKLNAGATTAPTGQTIKEGHLVSGAGLMAGTIVTAYDAATETVSLSYPIKHDVGAVVDTHASAIGSGATVLTMGTPVAVKKGDLVAGTGVAAGTTVDEDSDGGSHVTVKLDTATSGNMGASNAITFTSVLSFNPLTTALLVADYTGVAKDQTVCEESDGATYVRRRTFACRRGLKYKFEC